ncbi:MAG: sodium/proton-translocating pyrophosphatase, partial [Candidatus Thermoplasmatota archaeon]
LALIAAYKEKIALSLENLSITNPKLLVGVFIGGMLPFIFCALTMRAVGRAAEGIVLEVRRQFREMPGIMEGTTKPDYAKAVDICTKSAQKAMIIPASMAVISPVTVGLILGTDAVLGLLVGSLVTGFLLAITMANSGGAWDNAKKYIEGGRLGGKGSEAHKASVIGDTVGDPFKDTAGPSLNILIKLMSIVSLVFASVIAACKIW